MTETRTPSDDYLTREERRRRAARRPAPWMVPTSEPLHVYDVHHAEVGPVAWDPRTTRVVARDPKDAEQYVPTGHRILSVVPVPSREAPRTAPPAPAARDALVRLVASAIDGRRPADEAAAMALHDTAAERVVAALEASPHTADLLVRLIPVGTGATAAEGRERRRVLTILDALLDGRNAAAGRPGSWSAMQARAATDALWEARRLIGPSATPAADVCPRCHRLKEHPDPALGGSRWWKPCEHPFHGARRTFDPRPCCGTDPDAYHADDCTTAARTPEATRPRPPLPDTPHALGLAPCGDDACPVHSGAYPLTPQACHGNGAYCTRCSPRRCPSWARQHGPSGLPSGRREQPAPAGILTTPVPLPPEHVPPGVEVEVAAPRPRRRRLRRLPPTF